MSTGISLFIIIITVINVLACWWLVRWTSKKRPNEAIEGDVTGHKWDGLEEFNNPLPRWWLWMFYFTIIFSVVYFILYPGLGSFQGVLGWSSSNQSISSQADVSTKLEGSQYQVEMNEADATYGPIFAKYADMPLSEVAKDAEANKMGQRMFLTYCSQCHGSDAKGGPGFPNLTDNDWLYGGNAAQIKDSILKGRNGVMPPMGPMLDANGANGVKEVAAYVQSLSGREVDSALAAEGEKKFQLACIACHGSNAKGNQMLGAPNLTDNTWLYGGSAGKIEETIRGGRGGRMPAHKEFLGEQKVHLLAAYVYSLSNK